MMWGNFAIWEIWIPPLVFLSYLGPPKSLLVGRFLNYSTPWVFRVTHVNSSDSIVAYLATSAFLPVLWSLTSISGCRFRSRNFGRVFYAPFLITMAISPNFPIYAAYICFYILLRGVENPIAPYLLNFISLRIDFSIRCRIGAFWYSVLSSFHPRIR